METFRWAFIGAGTLAKSVAREIAASGRHEIASVYTRRAEKCEQFAAGTARWRPETPGRPSPLLG